MTGEVVAMGMSTGVFVIRALFTLISIVAVGIGLPYLWQIVGKIGIDISAANKKRFEEIVESAIDAIEEQAVAKKKAGQVAPTGTDKMAGALKLVHNLCEEWDVEEKGEAFVKTIIEAKLGKKRTNLVPLP